jgi:hypothetical protein
MPEKFKTLLWSAVGPVTGQQWLWMSFALGAITLAGGLVFGWGLDLLILATVVITAMGIENWRRRSA